MEKLKINIVDCPIYSCKLTGRGIHEYHEEALEQARDLYLNLYDKVYRKLMFRDFNPLWTADRKATNDIDPKDSLWAMYCFFFNVCLIKLLSKDYDIEIIDKTRSEFRNQQYLFRVLDHEGIKYTLNQKKYERKSYRNTFKKTVKRSIRELYHLICKSLDFINREFIKSSDNAGRNIQNKSNKKTIYLTIPPVHDKNVKFYLEWRYKHLVRHLKHFEPQGIKVVLVSTKDFSESGHFVFPFINANSLVTGKNRLGILLKSFLLKLKVIGFVRYQKLKAGAAPLEKYFLDHIPVEFYDAMKENHAFDKLFKRLGPGLLIMKGPLVYKGISIFNYNARKHGVRVLILGGRIMTSTRLTNCFLEAHKDPRYPAVLPDAVIVSDPISYEVIRKQSKKIKLYTTKTIDQPVEITDSVHNPFSVTLVLQKRKEMENMIDEVISAIQDPDNFVLNLKAHPDFPIYERLKKKYSKFPFVNILAIDTPLRKAVELSDLCISAYSTAVFEFLNAGKPVVWLNYVTLNSFLFSEVHKKMGLIANNRKELEKFLSRLKDDTEFYQTQKSLQYFRFQDFIHKTDMELNKVIDLELEKVSF